MLPLVYSVDVINTLWIILQLAAVEEEKNQLILDYERDLDQKKNNFEDQEKLRRKIEMMKSQVRMT